MQGHFRSCRSTHNEMSREQERHMDADRLWWNERTPVHARSDFYDVEGFKRGKLTVTSIERKELGEVAGRSLLHLQCHFGLDTLSWARLGAKVTGVDFSDEAIGLARSLSRELGIEAKFVLANVYDLPEVLEGKYDIVFTSYGVLSWLPDLPQWARVVAHFLKPRGTFYMVEGHPIVDVFDAELRPRFPYFHSPKPFEYLPDGQGSYADPGTPCTSPNYQWQHSMADVVNALISAGLRIDFLHEFPYAPWSMLTQMKQGDDGWWRLPEGQDSVPLLFSVEASKS